jgi:4-hydroxy-tetrahydrodipicolinate reductase
MNIALIGYGKMGKMVETVAIERGHRIVSKIDVSNQSDFDSVEFAEAHVVIEFTSPQTAAENIICCVKHGKPVVSGTTGWYDKMDLVKRICDEHDGTFLCASNFSPGVNMFFEINRQLASLMDEHKYYLVEIEETHHIQKLDAPSGTAITLAEDIICENHHIKDWELAHEGRTNTSTLPIHSIRKGALPGTHIVKYSSLIDDIEIKHVAHNREGFALGAVLAAEFIHDKKGIFTMRDVLQQKK